MNVRERIPPARALSRIVIGVSAVIYVLTSCRTVYVGDSGELSAALAGAGIAHPPGYPLYTILGHLWLKLFFFVSPAFAANLFSAAAAAAGAGLLYRLLERISRPHLPPIVVAAVALFYAFARPVWFSAVHAEVYALSGLLFIAALYSIIEYYYDRRMRRLIISAFLCGLVLTHHFSAGVVVVALVVVIAFRYRDAWSLRSLGSACLAFLMPLTLYLYLLLRFDPALPINWLEERSFSALWSLVSGENYRQFVGIATPSDLFLCVKKFTLKSLMFFGPGLGLLSIPGLIYIFRRDTRLATVLVVPAILNVYMTACYHIPDYEGYLAPSLVFAAVCVSLGISWLYSVRRISSVITALLAVVLVGVPLTANYSICDLSRFRLAERYGKDLLDSATSGSTVFLKSDNASHAGLYLRYVEGYRSDVEVFSSHCTMTRLAHSYGIDRSAPVLDSVLARIDETLWGVEYIVNQGMNPSPGDKIMRGMLYGPPGISADPELERRLDRFAVETLPSMDLNDDNKVKQIYLEYRLRCIDRLMTAGDQSSAAAFVKDLYDWGQSLDQARVCLAVARFFLARGMIDESLRWVDLARETEPMSYEEKDLFVNLGAIYRRAGSLEMAYKSLARALEINGDYEPARYNFTLVKAEMAVRQQDWPAALDAFSKLARLEKGNPLPYFNMAVVYDRMPGRESHAIANYDKFISLAGNSYPQAVKRAKERIAELDSAAAAIDSQ